VTHCGRPEDPPSPTSSPSATTKITATTTTSTSTSTVERDKSDDDTLQHAFDTPNKNLKPVTSFGIRGFQLPDKSYDSSSSSAHRSNQSPSSSQPSTQSSLTSSSSFSSTQSNDFQEDEIQKIEIILETVKTIADVCRICWVRKEVSPPHHTYHCPTRVCKGTNWEAFRSGIRFPGGILCYFCFVPYCPPFDHKRAPPGTKNSSRFCDYPDVIKELAYILYQDTTIRTKIFNKLEISPPSTPSGYKAFLAKRRSGGTFGIFEVVNAYVEIREEEEYSA
jgi:hypothetical protein